MGFVWINLDAKATVEVAWEDELGQVDVEERLQRFDAGKYHFDHQYEIVGDFNWKTLADNYNEVSTVHSQLPLKVLMSLNSATTVPLAIQPSIRRQTSDNTTSRPMVP